MSVPWRDKNGITHTWLVANDRLDNHHAGWHVARAPCGATRKLRHGRDSQHRPRDTEVDCMACIAEETG